MAPIAAIFMLVIKFWEPIKKFCLRIWDFLKIILWPQILFIKMVFTVFKNVFQGLFNIIGWVWRKSQGFPEDVRIYQG